jgi:TonB family protein
MLIGPSPARRLSAALFALVFLCSAEPLFAQGANDAELSPPRLTETVEPEYPPEEKARGTTATVVLTLDIDDEGRVSHAVVATSAGAAFDAAALEAAARLHFAPATRGGRPIRSKIPFQFAFALAREVAPSTTALAVRPTDIPPLADDGADNGGPVDIEVRGQRAPRESTKQVLERAEIATMPGTNGDALHAVENLPGVARTSGISSNLVVRGSGPQDTGVFADGVWLINAFHFGGITSVIPTEVLERLDFYPGNFSPEYGRQMGGIIDLGIRSPRKDRFGGLMQFDLLDGRMLAEGPLGPSTRFLVAGRRSWVDAWLRAAQRGRRRQRGAGLLRLPSDDRARFVLLHHRAAALLRRR